MKFEVKWHVNAAPLGASSFKSPRNPICIFSPFRPLRPASRPVKGHKKLITHIRSTAAKPVSCLLLSLLIVQGAVLEARIGGERAALFTSVCTGTALLLICAGGAAEQERLGVETTGPGVNKKKEDDTFGDNDCAD